MLKNKLFHDIIDHIFHYKPIESLDPCVGLETPSYCGQTTVYGYPSCGTVLITKYERRALAIHFGVNKLNKHLYFFALF